MSFCANTGRVQARRERRAARRRRRRVPPGRGVAMSRERSAPTSPQPELHRLADRARLPQPAAQPRGGARERPSEGGTRLGARSRAPGSEVGGAGARSAPAGGGAQDSGLRNHSPDTRRVRFADALGLELAAVLLPPEKLRVPRHVQVQLQRDALPPLRAVPAPRPRPQVGGRGTPLPQDFLSLASADVWGVDLPRSTHLHPQPWACSRSPTLGFPLAVLGYSPSYPRLPRRQGRPPGGPNASP